jgi:hypothetical protein
MQGYCHDFSEVRTVAAQSHSFFEQTVLKLVWEASPVSEHRLS